MEKVLEGEIALVTGASRGIGAAIADELAALGATVIGTATTEAGAQAIGERLAAHGGARPRAERHRRRRGRSADRSIAQGIRRGLDPGQQRRHHARQLLMRMKDEDWQAILDTNLSSVYRTSQGGHARHDEGAQGPHHQHRLGDRRDRQCRAGELRRGQGRHHRVLQVAGARDRLARHHGQRGRARLHRHRHDTRAARSAARRRCSARSRSGRLGEPADIAKAVAFLARPAAAYITGETLHVNGGMYMP